MKRHCTTIRTRMPSTKALSADEQRAIKIGAFVEMRLMNMKQVTIA